MGHCYKCGKEISLKDNETKCDYCGTELRYTCHTCHQTFDIVNKEGVKLKECKTCGYFYCPNCGVCGGANCDKTYWVTEIRKIFLDTLTTKQIKNLLTLIENIKVSKDRRVCCRNVPISYAKNRIKSLLGKFEGFKTKGKEDINAFDIRIDKVTKLPLGTELTITNTRELGNYGQEYRDAFNLLICLGKLKVEKRKRIIRQEKIEYQCFIRCDDAPCKFFKPEKLIKNVCTTCHNTFGVEVIYCPKCEPYKKGKNKGEKRKLKKQLVNVDVCQFKRGMFNKLKNG